MKLTKDMLTEMVKEVIKEQIINFPGAKSAWEMKPGDTTVIRTKNGKVKATVHSVQESNNETDYRLKIKWKLPNGKIAIGRYAEDYTFDLVD